MPDLTMLPTHIAHIQKTGDDHIACGAISSDGSALAFSDRQGLHLYQLSAQHDANGPDSTSAMDIQADEPDLAVSKAVMTLQTVASGPAGPKLMRRSAPKGLPSFVELQYRPGCAQLIGLTPEGTLVAMDTQSVVVRLYPNMRMHLLIFQRSLPGRQQTIRLGACLTDGLSCRRQYFSLKFLHVVFIAFTRQASAAVIPESQSGLCCLMYCSCLSTAVGSHLVTRHPFCSHASSSHT